MYLGFPVLSKNIIRKGGSILNKILEYILFVLGIIALILFLTFVSNSTLKNSEIHINKVISNRGGGVLSIESKLFDIGPFNYRDKNSHIYRIEYKLNGTTKEGWMRTGVLSNDYILDNAKKESIKK